MTTERTPSGLIGRSVRRVEDPMLITGKCLYSEHRGHEVYSEHRGH
jgi:hypothetical protein